MQPQLFFTSKNLGYQGSRVEKRKNAMRTQNIEINTVNTVIMPRM